MIQDKEYYYETICTLYVWMTSCIMDNSFCQGIFDWTQKKLHGNTLINLVLICVVSCRGQVDAIQFWSLVLATGTWLLLKTFGNICPVHSLLPPVCTSLVLRYERCFFPWPIFGMVLLASGVEISWGLSNVFASFPCWANLVFNFLIDPTPQAFASIPPVFRY